MRSMERATRGVDVGAGVRVGVAVGTAVFVGVADGIGVDVGGDVDASLGTTVGVEVGTSIGVAVGAAVQATRIVAINSTRVFGITFPSFLNLRLLIMASALPPAFQLPQGELV